MKGDKVNVLGLTFKESCADLRNSEVIDIINELRSYAVDVAAHDPVADTAEALHGYGVALAAWDDLPRADAIVAAVAHRSYQALSITQNGRELIDGGSFVDVNAGFGEAALIAANMRVWQL